VDREQSNKPRATRGITRYGSRIFASLVRDDGAALGETYASPTVSNIAASIASVVVLPAHTTNWNAGK
jgi:hypothetical protein